MLHDHVQAFDTKCGEVLPAGPDRPTGGVWECLYKAQVQKSDEFKYVLQVYAPETTFGDKKNDYRRLKLMAQRRLEQKIKDSNFKSRNSDEDRPAIEAPSKNKANGIGKDNAKNNSERRDLEASKKSRGKGRPRSPSTLGSPHRGPKSDGKGSDCENAKSTRKLAGESPSAGTKIHAEVPSGFTCHHVRNKQRMATNQTTQSAGQGTRKNTWNTD